MSDMDICYIYMIATIRDDDVACAPVKIGITKSPGARLATIKTGSPRKVDIACVLMANRSAIQIMERMFHSEWSNHALDGEWFDVPPLPAAQSLAKIYRSFFEGAKLSQEDIWNAVNESGLYALEKKCEAEQYIRAWEQA